jgi:rRNA maturation RNase YbeY
MGCIKIHNLHPEFFLLRPATELIANEIANCEKRPFKKVEIIATDDQMLNNLKMRFFGENVLTDTISFNLNEDGMPIEGEVYLSLDRIKENAEKYQFTFEKELANVIIHSLLHLLGYNDEDHVDRKQMFALQNFYLQRQVIKRLYRKRRNVIDR